jgi:hypothetical protein
MAGDNYPAISKLSLVVSWHPLPGCVCVPTLRDTELWDRKASVRKARICKRHNLSLLSNK